MRRVALFAAALLIAGAARAEGLRLSLPLDCRLGETCWVMNYADAEPGPEARDFRCRPRSYDAHTGTDFAIRDLKAVEAGVPVLAVAAGSVVQTRDGEEDGLWIAGRQQEVRQSRKECGNRVAIQHEGGWVTDYCHMRKGSIAVKPGDRVAAGQRLGLVGMSGMTAFPHIHVGLLRDQAKVPVDPFTGADLAQGCGRPPASLWSGAPAYEPLALYAAGISGRTPTSEGLKADASSPATLPADAPEMLVWGAAFGVDAGDVLTMRLLRPDGSVLAEGSHRYEKAQAWSSLWTGRRRPEGGWQRGVHRGEVTLQRPGEPARTRSVSVEVR